MNMPKQDKQKDLKEQKVWSLLELAEMKAVRRLGQIR
jgi:hypothetical protein